MRYEHVNAASHIFKHLNLVEIIRVTKAKDGVHSHGRYAMDISDQEIKKKNKTVLLTSRKSARFQTTLPLSHDLELTKTSVLDT